MTKYKRATIPCDNCGARLDSLCETCPHCGEEILGRMSEHVAQITEKAMRKWNRKAKFKSIMLDIALALLFSLPFFATACLILIDSKYVGIIFYLAIAGYLGNTLVLIHFVGISKVRTSILLIIYTVLSIAGLCALSLYIVSSYVLLSGFPTTYLLFLYAGWVFVPLAAAFSLKRVFKNSAIKLKMLRKVTISIVIILFVVSLVFNGFIWRQTKFTWLHLLPVEDSKGAYYFIMFDGITPLHLAAWDGKTTTVGFLIFMSVNVNATDGKGRTPLYYAVGNGHTKTAEFLISKGADINAKDNDGRTPLRWAAFGHTKTAELLMSKGAEVNAKDNSGLTALDWAINFNFKETEKLLRAHGAKTGEELRAKKK